MAPLVEQALAVVHREYPNHILHYLEGDADVAPPRELTPAFWGAFDWHSCVHTHWLLARALRLFPAAGFADATRAALERSLTPDAVAGEVRYVTTRPSFEVPYGAAWLLTLDSELGALDDADARRWRAALAPLADCMRAHFQSWLGGLVYPVRGGLHNQSAFAMGLVLDHARACGRDDLSENIAARALAFHGEDRDAPLAYEPSGHDFLSPVLGVADLMHRVYPAARFATWLEQFLGADFHTRAPWPTPVRSPDPTDGRLAHLDGLNLSRAWMLDAIADALPPEHRFREVLRDAARAHEVIGLEHALTPHYAGSHWLGTFAVYHLTGRGLQSPAHGS